MSFGQTYRESIAPYSSRLQLVQDGGSPLPGFRFFPSPGHTPGHSYIRIESKGETLIVAGDTWMSKVRQPAKLTKAIPMLFLLNVPFKQPFNSLHSNI